MTYFVGIDIAKYEHVVSIYNSSTGEITLDSLHFDSSVKGFKTLLSRLSKLNRNKVVIGFESTAHYHQNLFSYLTDKKYKCYLINRLPDSDLFPYAMPRMIILIPVPLLSFFRLNIRTLLKSNSSSYSTILIINTCLITKQCKLHFWNRYKVHTNSIKN